MQSKQPHETSSSRDTTALKITFFYLILGVLWITLSDNFLLAYFTHYQSLNVREALEQVTEIQRFKGWFYVIATALSLYILINTGFYRLASCLHKITNLEHQQSEILKNLPIGVYETDSQGNLMYQNKRATDLTGKHTTQDRNVLFRSCSNNNFDRLEKAWLTTFKNRLVFFQQYQITNTNTGKSYTVIDQAFPKFNAQKQFTGYTGTLTDVTPLCRAHDRIDQTEQSLQISMRVGNIGLWDWEIATDQVYFSPEWKAQLGFEEYELGNDFSVWKDRLHPADKGKALATVQAFMENPQGDYQNEFRLRHKDGSYRWIYVHGTMQFDGNGEPERLIGTHTDITEIKQTQLDRQLTEDRLHYLLENSSVIMYSLEMDENGEIIPRYISDNITRILGFTVEETMTGHWWNDNIHPGDRDRVVSSLHDITVNTTHEDYYRFLDKQGKTHWVKDYSRVMTFDNNENGNREIWGLVIDFTEEHESAEMMESLDAAFLNMDDGVLVTDKVGKILSCNPAAENMFGSQNKPLVNANMIDLVSDIGNDNFMANLMDELQDKQHWRGNCWALSHNGTRLPIWLTANVIANNTGQVKKLMFIYRDMTEIHQKREQLTRLAHYDALTGLPNRDHLSTLLENAIRKAASQKKKLAALYIDLDDFKYINEGLGYDTGNQVLAKITEHLQAQLAPGDILGRLGGDEFILVTEVDKAYQDSLSRAQLLVESFKAPFSLQDMQSVLVSTSVGISLYPQNGDTADKLIRRSDLAMNHAKLNGKDMVTLFTEELENETANQLALINNLHDAIQKDEFQVYYQPSCALEENQNRYAGAEALVRWKQGSDMVSPGKFIPVAESTGLINRIGHQVLVKVCRQIRQWLDEGKNPGVISVNLSVRQFRDPHLLSNISNALQKFRVPPENLAIEITESALMHNPEQVSEIILKLQRMGLKIYLDDFGTGFSSFAYLSRLTLDVLKIDMTFVRNINKSDKDNQIILSMLEIGRNLGMKSIAEGVETEEQLEFLKTHHCNAIQGYYCNPPLPVEEFETKVLIQG